VVLATKVAGPSRNMDWVRQGSTDLKPADVVQACEDSLRRLQTEVIDLCQIHWPNRNCAIFGGLYFDPAKDQPQTSIHDQLQALAGLVRAGKVRHVGLSNETPWGLSEFVHLAEQHGLPRVVTVQNPYALVNRSVDNGLDEALHRTGVSLLAYSPLGFCCRSWRVASTLIGVNTVAQLDEKLAAWGVQLAPELLAAVDAVRRRLRDPAQ
jgi:aryl-alcohol dehydrogenase-like predicted oxidoreductase